MDSKSARTTNDRSVLKIYQILHFCFIRRKMTDPEINTNIMIYSLFNHSIIVIQYSRHRRVKNITRLQKMENIEKFEIVVR